jgi:hypothetical protein
MPDQRSQNNKVKSNDVPRFLQQSPNANDFHMSVHELTTHTQRTDSLHLPTKYAKYAVVVIVAIGGPHTHTSSGIGQPGLP